MGLKVEDVHYVLESLDTEINTEEPQTCKKSNNKKTLAGDLSSDEDEGRGFRFS